MKGSSGKTVDSSVIYTSMLSLSEFMKVFF